MTKQKEIREGMAEEIYDIILEYKYGCKQVGNKGNRFRGLNANIQKQLLGWADQFLKYLHSQGVVIKHGEGEWDLWVEPLIKEE